MSIKRLWGAPGSARVHPCHTTQFKLAFWVIHCPPGTLHQELHLSFDFWVTNNILVNTHTCLALPMPLISQFCFFLGDKWHPGQCTCMHLALPMIFILNLVQVDLAIGPSLCNCQESLPSWLTHRSSFYAQFCIFEQQISSQLRCIWCPSCDKLVLDCWHHLSQQKLLYVSSANHTVHAGSSMWTLPCFLSTILDQVDFARSIIHLMHKSIQVFPTNNKSSIFLITSMNSLLLSKHPHLLWLYQHMWD